ncbi:MAG TPA: amino acid deaminase [Casimicrobiaceae bacterium]|nr:amino acid deaminase [Casimicrobiaceae bacterium]
MNLDPILSETLDATTKGYPLSSPSLSISEIGAQRWSVLAGDLPLPLALIRDSALAHNHAWMRDFTASTGVLLAPHGKTTMAPQIFAQQLAAGAWGITVANVQQLGLCVRFGVRRVIMANQLLGRAEVGAVIRLHEAHPDLEFHFLVDSRAQLAAIENLAASQTMSRKLTALVELGVPGGRTGARTCDDGLAVARAVAASKTVALSGLECYEGLQVTGDSVRDEIVVAGLMQRVHDVALACDREGLFAGPSIILTAGGSAAFDIVARDLPMKLSKPVLTILRSGCYVTHDSGFYNRMLDGVKARSGAVWQSRPGLKAALEVWSRVQSCPEPGLAILTMGKRDASFDLDMPIPAKRCRPGVDTKPQPAPPSWKIANMNDQHAYLRFAPDEAPQVGDLVGCGISHPCTTFDKWRALFTVDDDYRVTGAIRTFF